MMIIIVGMKLSYMKALMKRATESLKIIIFRSKNCPMGLYSHLLGEWLRAVQFVLYKLRWLNIDMVIL